MSLTARFKRDIFKHRGRAALLGVLFVTMVVVTVKAIIDLRPPTAAASTAVTNLPKEQPRPAVNSAEAVARINESRHLWRVLREVKQGAADTAVAFAFDPVFYPPPPESIKKAPTPVEEPAVRPAPVAPVVDQQALKEARIREQSRGLVVKSTAIGNSGTRPMAIINQQLVFVGQEINGFELTAIRAREVEFVKEGVSVVVKMPDGQ